MARKKAEATEEAVAKTGSTLVKVQLADGYENYTCVILKNRVVDFSNGEAMVSEGIKKELVAEGFVKE